MEIVVAAVIAALVALAAGWLLWGRGVAQTATDRDTALTERDAARAENGEYRVQIARTMVEIAAQQRDIGELKEVARSHAVVAGELAAAKATQAERDAAHGRQLAALDASFAALATKALDGAQAAFLERAEAALVRHREVAGVGLEANRTAMAAMIAPMTATLGAYATKLDEIEKVRAEGYGALNALLDQVAKGQDRVTGATARLETVLRSSGKAAGRWGEEQCRNVLERVGLVEGIDFVAQTSAASDDNRRPDFVVTLPGERRLVIDVKCSVDAYMAAAGTDDVAERARHLGAHARAVRSHATALAGKAYEKSVGGAVDFVVLFVPGENFLAAAFEHDRDLLFDFDDRRLVLAGPINLIAVARTVAAMRDQARLAKQAAEIARLGRELYDSVRVMGGKATAMQKALGGAVNAANDLVKSLDGRVLSRAKKFEAHGATTGLETIGEVGLVEALPVLPTNLDLPPAALAAE